MNEPTIGREIKHFLKAKPKLSRADLVALRKCKPSLLRKVRRILQGKES
jgi:hypothetical protein